MLTRCGQLSRLAVLGALLVTMGSFGCARPKVRVPPRVDLRSWSSIGLVQIECAGTDSLGRYPTERFLQSVQSSQPGIPILELGSERELLAEVGHRQLDFQAVRAIGARYGVDALLVGRFEFTKPTPRLSVSGGLSSLRAEAKVRGTFNARLLATQSGATVWTTGARAERTLASLRAARRGPIDFDAGKLQDPYSPLIRSLVHDATWELRPTWERR